MLVSDNPAAANGASDPRPDFVVRLRLRAPTIERPEQALANSVSPVLCDIISRVLNLEGKTEIRRPNDQPGG